MCNCIIFVVFFVVLESNFFRRFKSMNLKYYSSRVLEPGNTVFLLLIAFCLCVFSLSYLRFSNGSALFLLLQTGDASEALLARKQLYETGLVFGVRLQYLNTFFVFSEIVLVYFIYLVLNRFRLRYLALLIFLFLSLALWHMSNTSKGYSIIIFMYIFVVLSYNNKGVYHLKSILILALFAIVISSPIAYFFMGNDSIYLLYPIERFLVGNLLPHYVIFSYFDLDSFLFGSSVPSWYSFGAHEQFLLAEWNWRFMNNKMFSLLAYNNPSSFIAESYANFGYFGFAVIPFVVMYIVIVSVTAIRIVPRQFSPIVLVFLTVYYSKYSIKEFMTTVVDYRLVSVIFTISFLLLSFNEFKASYSKRRST